MIRTYVLNYFIKYKRSIISFMLLSKNVNEKLLLLIFLYYTIFAFCLTTASNNIFREVFSSVHKCKSFYGSSANPFINHH